MLRRSAEQLRTFLQLVSGWREPEFASRPTLATNGADGSPHATVAFTPVYHLFEADRCGMTARHEKRHWPDGQRFRDRRCDAAIGCRRTWSSAVRVRSISAIPTLDLLTKDLWTLL